MDSGDLADPARSSFGQTVGNQVTQEIARPEHVLMPLLKRCHRIMARSFTHLEARRSKGAPLASVVVGQVGQVNVECVVTNEVDR
jgi:hypothetical protein